MLTNMPYYVDFEITLSLAFFFNRKKEILIKSTKYGLFLTQGQKLTQKSLKLSEKCWYKVVDWRN